jgi:hypothetical protein
MLPYHKAPTRKNNKRLLLPREMEIDYTRKGCRLSWKVMYTVALYRYGSIVVVFSV